AAKTLPRQRGPLLWAQGIVSHGWNTEQTRIKTRKEEDMELAHSDVTGKIIGAAFEVYKVLGYGFLERVYQRAMQVEIVAQGLKTELEAKIKVMYKGVVVGDYEADLLVQDCVVVELKVAKDY